MLEIMKEYGWDYNTYQDQPTWVLDLAARKLGIEAQLAAKAAETPTQPHA